MNLTDLSPEIGAPYQSEKISLNGMRCAACAQLIEFRLKQLKGVSKVSMNYAGHRVDVSWQPDTITLHKIIDAVQDLSLIHI